MIDFIFYKEKTLVEIGNRSIESDTMNLWSKEKSNSLYEQKCREIEREIHLTERREKKQELVEKMVRFANIGTSLK